ncbi:response regulator [Anabaena sp. UHCC 0204]|uniref:hybrid sensor histidine kinase/response regulator n=1 Tax=Anabaena sp. UHCC 0204 TaxID=2590009 RepID=UPI001444E9AF|nr:response regulator [Anabaena sp. UHCC 0204]MTJ07972.1 response regulator [Anabaena sp. UHCC 0204]
MNIQDRAFLADILIVDDKLENIRFLSDFLSKQNYQIRKAISGQAALMAVKTLPPDLILLDINMPTMGGYEVCKILKTDSKTSSIPIIFLSAGNDINDKIQAFQAGGIDYITKPFHLEEVLLRVQNQLTVQNLQNELKIKNEQLQNTIVKLQNTQYELIQKEKLVNASRITAGISHEINNPLSFILGNLNPAFDYTQTLINLVQLYQQAFPEATLEISNLTNEIDLDFLIQDFTRIMYSIRTGAERINSVVCAMHIFSRLNQSGIKRFNVCDNIDSVLITLGDQITLKDKSSLISVRKNYEDIPMLMGHANLFNQVLLNLLQNAIDSFDSDLISMMDSFFEPTIWITTKLIEENQIMISVKDNGIGILEEYQEHLFEPFFTTKLVGKGVGLGLFTSYQIITEIYKGTLTYYSCPEGGSEFLAKIPLTQNF